jgi:chromate reductase
MAAVIRIAGISGSLRKDSFNTKLLNHALELLPKDTEMEILSIADIPLYNADLDLPEAKSRPDSVTEFRKRLASADGLLIVSPEYNYSIPGGLKNAIDWASRGEDSPLLRKPVAVMGATPGMWGTARMQLAFHAVFQFLDMRVVQKPEILIASAQTKFNTEGKLNDEKTIGFVRQKLEGLRKMILQMQGQQG